MFNQAIYSLSESDLDFILKNGKRSSVLDGFDFESLIHCSWKFLKETLPELMKKGNFEKLVHQAFVDRGQNRFEVDISLMPVDSVMAFLNWIRDELNQISEMEREFLVSEPDPDMNAAGINDLDVFGNMNVIDSLSGGDVLKHEAVKSLAYSVIFDKQLKSIKENAINKKYAKLKSKKP